MKRFVLLVLVCLLTLPMFSTASAAKQLYGEVTKRGSASDYVFKETQAGASFSGIHACLEFCVYANSNVSQTNTYIRTNVYYSFSEGGYGTRVGTAEFRQNLVAAAGVYFPAEGQFERVVSSSTFSIQNTLYYRTVLNSNIPYAITGTYHGWISNTSSGN